MKIVVNTQDLGEYASIDTYQKYSSSSTEDLLVENYNYRNDTDYTYESFEWSHDTKGIIDGLGEQMAKQLVELPLIKSAKCLKTYSPQYYNYQTNSADIELEFDEKKLQAYIDKDLDSFIAFVHTSSWNTTVASKEGDEKKRCEILAKLNYYVDKVYPETHGLEDFTMYEVASNLWCDNTKMTLIEES